MITRHLQFVTYSSPQHWHCTMFRVHAACATRKDLYLAKFTAFSRRSATFEDSPTSMPHYESLVDRGLYLEREYRRSAKARLSGVSVLDGGKNVEIQWSNGTYSRYHSMWLRQACHCPSCRHPTNRSTVNFQHVDVDATIVHAETEGDKVLKVTWSDDSNHTGVFPPPFLKRYSYNDRDREEREAEMKMIFNTSPQPSIPEVSYKDIMKSESGLYEWLKILNELGICLVKDVPTRALEVKKVAERIGSIMSTLHGEVFDVTYKTNPTNVAFSEERLQLHMDQIAYESPPGIQCLHCLRFDKEVKGGHSFFVDIFHVAETLRTTYPEEFQNLLRIPATFNNIFYGREAQFHMVYQRPHITLNHDGMIVGVAWHPGVTGPLMTKEEDVEDYYKAYKCMATMMNTFPYQYKCRLGEGDLISFNNRRVLHGRDHYDTKSGHRHLQGCYVQVDEFKNQVQVYSNTMGDGKLATRVGNLDLQ